MIAGTEHIRTWIFDLDNTLYPPSAQLFDLIDERMGQFLAARIGCDLEQARRIQKSYFRDHGTTLAGMMANHGADPHEFLDFVHDIPLDRLRPDPQLAAQLDALPGRKLVFTNGDEDYARRVLKARGLDTVFEAIFDIHKAQYRPKPAPETYRSLCDALAIDPGTSLFAEDMARNLRPAKAIGMTTLWIDNGSELGNHDADHDGIDFVTDDIAAWLAAGA